MMKYAKALFYALAMYGCAAAFRNQAISMWNEPNLETLAIAAGVFGLGTYFAHEAITALTK